MMHPQMASPVYDHMGAKLLPLKSVGDAASHMRKANQEGLPAVPVRFTRPVRIHVSLAN
jgi:hypothetical protein